MDLFGLSLLYLLKMYNNMWAIPGIDTTAKVPQYCDLKLRIYHPCNSRIFEVYCLEEGMKLFTSSELYDRNRCNTVFLGIPFYNNMTSYNVVPMIEALTSRCEFNVIVMDNSVNTDPDSFVDYAITMLRVYKDMLRYAQVFNQAIDLGLLSGQCVRAVGFSLGAQQVGQVCRMLKEKCRYILAIDPAGPLFAPRQLPLIKQLPHLHLVSKKDACHVVFVECNRWLMGTAFGSAHENIVVNGGIFQPTCSKLNILCSHEFCNKVVIDAIRRPGQCLAAQPNGFNILWIRNEQLKIFDLILPRQVSPVSCENTDSRDLFMASAPQAPVCTGSQGAAAGVGFVQRVTQSIWDIIGNVG